MTVRAERLLEVEHVRGPADRPTEIDRVNGRTDGHGESDGPRGPDTPLARLAAMYEDLQRSRLAAEQRGFEFIAAGLLKLEQAAGRQITAELKRHELYPWLEQFPGLRGIHVATLVAIIDNPHRFPRPGARGDGVRALWHYCGLHVVDGRLPRRKKGQRSTWSPRLRRACLMPDAGIAAQIVRHRPPVYGAVYETAKARLIRDRAVACPEDEEQVGPVPTEQAKAECGDVTDARDGLRPTERAEVGGSPEIECSSGLRPFEIERRARTIAVKAFVGDLLMAWKRVAS